MPDNLDNEALEFMNSRQSGSSKTAFNEIQLDLGGKRIKTQISKKERLRDDATYISDEPERFIDQIKDLKDKFINEEQAMKAIIKKFEKDSSLGNLISGLVRRKSKDHMRKEVMSIVQTKQVQSWLSYQVVAKRLGITPQVFAKKTSTFTDKKKLDTLLEKIASASQKERRGISIKRKDLFLPTQKGTIKGKQVEGNLTFVKIFGKRVPKYVDPVTKRFIKVG
jgi:hypothetical protein